jgi:hypothetical protein
MSLEASGPHLMMKGTKATGARCRQCSLTATKLLEVGRAGSGFMPTKMTQFAPAEQPRAVVANSVVMATSRAAWRSHEIGVRRRRVLCDKGGLRNRRP